MPKEIAKPQAGLLEEVHEPRHAQHLDAVAANLSELLMVHCDIKTTTNN